MSGWIKLHRKIQDKGFSKDPHYFSIWIHCLLNANHEEKETLVNGSTMLIKPGQFITSRLKMSQQSGVQQSKVERILNYLESEQQIEQQSLTTCRLLSIINWEKYQISEQQTELVMNSKRTASEQQVNTNKNDKNTKNEKNEKKTTLRCTLQEAIDFCLSLGLSKSDGEYCFHHWEGNGWMNGKHSIKDWKATIKAWSYSKYLPSQRQSKYTESPHERAERLLRNIKNAK